MTRMNYRCLFCSWLAFYDYISPPDSPLATLEYYQPKIYDDSSPKSPCFDKIIYIRGKTFVNSALILNLFDISGVIRGSYLKYRKFGLDTG